MSTLEWKVDQLKTRFGDHEFTSKDIISCLDMPNHYSVGGLLKALHNRQLIINTKSGYRFTNGSASIAPLLPAAKPESPIPPAPLPRMIKINGYYIAPQTTLIVDTLQPGKVTIHTSILEIDGETKHPRNKRLIFTQQHAPDEYAAVLAWLRANSDTPVSTPDDTQAALQLAEEASAKLQSAQEEIAQLKTKIAQFRKMLE